MISEAIQKLAERENLTEQEARASMEEIMAGQATDAQIAGFLTVLRMKGETATELIGFARVMREKAEPLWDGEVLTVLDTCGTGGDRSGTFDNSDGFQHSRSAGESCRRILSGGWRIFVRSHGSHGQCASWPGRRVCFCGSRCGWRR